MGLYSGIVQIIVKCLQPGGDCLLHIGVCCKLLASQVLVNGFRELAVSAPHTANQSVLWLGEYGSPFP
jgi:hypothetical protein